MSQTTREALEAERHSQYGDKRENWDGIAMGWAPLLHACAAEVAAMKPIPRRVAAAMMVVVKLNRLRRQFKQDSYDDLSVYASFAEEWHAEDAAKPERFAVYLSGPMRGMPGHNAAAFDAAARRLRAAGFDVLNPGESAGCCDDEPTRPQLRRVFAADLCAVALKADGVALLPGWERSRGAVAEVAAAKAIGVPIGIVTDEGIAWEVADEEAEQVDERGAGAAEVRGDELGVVARIGPDGEVGGEAPRAAEPGAEPGGAGGDDGGEAA